MLNRMKKDLKGGEINFLKKIQIGRGGLIHIMINFLSQIFRRSP